MNIGIVGMGLIGGSMAKAAKKNTEYTVYGYDIDTAVTDYAVLSGCIDGVLDSNTLSVCDYVFVCLYPGASAQYITDKAGQFCKGSTVIDCSGIKRSVCEAGFSAARDNDFHFIGGHPMAGTQFSGLKYSKDTMFHNACFILVPDVNEDISVIDNARKTVLGIGFSRISVMTAQRHDELIAYTSQLAHIVSNAYVKSPSAQSHKGISAGSYRDLTRVASLNETMWTELFLLNRDNLLTELSGLIAELQEYRDALTDNDARRLCELLRLGRIAKESAD